jgi:RNA polymerase sigma-70 factor (ECF subfamily)
MKAIGRFGPSSSPWLALRGWHGFDAERGGVRPYLFGIATRLVGRHRRREIRRYRALGRVGREEVTDSHETRVVSWVTAEGPSGRGSDPVRAGLAEGARRLTCEG